MPKPERPLRLAEIWLGFALAPLFAWGLACATFVPWLPGLATCWGGGTRPDGEVTG